jgi:hypothetical protein
MIKSYTLGYSNGQFRANDANFASGDQCKDGLKMIVAIGRTPLDNRYDSDSSSHYDTDPFATPPTQLAGITRCSHCMKYIV